MGLPPTCVRLEFAVVFLYSHTQGSGSGQTGGGTRAPAEGLSYGSDVRVDYYL